jgi:transposase InsO family protein
MGYVIKAESYKVEYAFVQEAEYSDDVLEYYDQPPAIRLEYLSRSGRSQRPWHTADYFVLRQTEVGWEECKPEQELQRLARLQPHRYCLDDTGEWRCPPGEAYATPRGLYYRVRSSRQINWIAQANWEYLADYYRRFDNLIIKENVATAVAPYIEGRPGISLAQLRREAPYLTADDLNILIVKQLIYVDLNTYRLAEPEQTPVYSSHEEALAYVARSQRTQPSDTIEARGTRAVEIAVDRLVDWDAVTWRINTVSAREIRLVPFGAAGAEEPLTMPRRAFSALIDSGRITGSARAHRDDLTSAARDLLARASASALAEETRRAELRKRYLAVGSAASSDQLSAATIASARTLRRWSARWRDAEIAYGSGFIGLLPTYHRCGRGAQLPDDCIALIETVIATYYDSVTHRLKRGAYGEFLLRCAEAHLEPPSERTFYRRVKHHLPAAEQAQHRSGARGAYRYKDFHREQERTVTRHGDHAWSTAYIDHTELDIELVSADTGKRLGRPWLTLLISGSTRLVLAYTLSFDRPTAASCMLALRECVRRHHRLPQTLVVDGGAEFRSVYFEALLARYEVTKRQRPPHEPRFGAVLERLFGTANTQFIYHLLGNTQLTHQKRQVTVSTNPKTHACWTLKALAERLEEWAYHLYAQISHPALGQSPRDAYTQSLERDGARTHLHIPYDQDFIVSTYASTRKGSAKVQPGRGVQIHHLFYWCDAMRDPSVEGQSAPVRYDPYDITVAYAYIRGLWRRCVIAQAADFAGCSERELALLTQELRRRQQIVRGRATVEITQRQLAEFQRSNAQTEQVLMQRLRDHELREARYNEGGVEPSRRVIDIRVGGPRPSVVAVRSARDGDEPFRLRTTETDLIAVAPSAPGTAGEEHASDIRPATRTANPAADEADGGAAKALATRQGGGQSRRRTRRMDVQRDEGGVDMDDDLRELGRYLG